MGTITDKLTLLNTSKINFKEMLQYANSNITDETTFRDYVKGVFDAYINILNNPDDLFNALPKKAVAADTSQNISGTIKAPMRITLKSSQLNQRNIPSEYTQVDYIESSGTQYIDIGKKAGSTTKFEIKFQMNIASAQYDSAFGSRDDNNFFINNGNANTNMFYWYNNSYVVLGDFSNDYNIVTYDVPNSIIKNYNETSKTELTNNVTFTVFPDLNIYLFARNQSGTPVYASNGMKLWHCKMYENNVLTMELIPCYRNSDNKVGMYDIVRNKFYTNTGTEDFTYGGIATPTPSTPQDIHTISGDNSVVVEGKNLFSEDNFITAMNPNILVSKTTIDNEEVLYVDAQNTTAKTYKPNLKPNTQYTLTLNVSSALGSGDGEFNFDYSDGTSTYQRISSLTSSFKTITKTSTSGKTLTGIRFRFYSVVNNKYYFKNIMLNEGTSASSFEPYVSQTAPINLDTIEYCKIGNYEDEFILTSGKNLLNPNVATSNCSVDTTTGIITITANSTDIYIKGAYVYSEANKFLTLPSGTYYIKSTNSKVRITMYGDSNGTLKSLDTANNQPQTLTDTINFGGLRIRSTDSSSLQNVSFGIMLSTTDTPYEPYGTNQWYLKKNIGKVVLDGSENWQNQFGESLFGTNLSSKKINTNSLSYCNYFTFHNIQSSLNTNLLNGEYTIQIGTNDTFYCKNTNYTNTTDFKTWLGTHNTIVYYPLKTPTYTQITGTLETQLNNIYKNMLSYDGTTNISQVNNDLPFTINTSVLEDLE